MTTQSADHLSAAAERMRRARQRRKTGMRCLTLELRNAEIAALVRLGFLPGPLRSDSDAVREALYWFLDLNLNGEAAGDDTTTATAERSGS